MEPKKEVIFSERQKDVFGFIQYGSGNAVMHRYRKRTTHGILHIHYVGTMRSTKRPAAPTRWNGLKNCTSRRYTCRVTATTT